jgi:hypothetical protein
MPPQPYSRCAGWIRRRWQTSVNLPATAAAWSTIISVRKRNLVAELAKRTQAQFVAQLEHEGLDPFDVLVKLVETYLVDVVRHDEIGRAFFVMWGTAIQADASLRIVFASDDAQFRHGVEALLRAGTTARWTRSSIRARPRWRWW